MKTIRLDVRYYHLTRRASVTEGEFHLRTLRRDYPADRIALVTRRRVEPTLCKHAPAAR